MNTTRPEPLRSSLPDHEPVAPKRAVQPPTPEPVTASTVGASVEEPVAVLRRRYWALSSKSKPSAKIVTALARSRAGFIWAIGVEPERALTTAKAA